MHIFWCRTWLWSCVILSSIIPTLAVLRNRTIDDLYGDDLTGVRPTYSPPMAFNKGQDCSSCTVSKKVNVTEAHNGTWTEATNLGVNDLSITFPFNGTAVYVFCIVPNYIASGITTMASLDFLVDGADVGSYVHKPDNTSDFSYRVPVYTNTSLKDAPHTFEIRPQGDPSLGNDGHSLVMFDYAVYSYDDGEKTFVASSATKHKPPIGAIIGGVLGGQLIVVGGLILLWLRRRKQRILTVKSVAATTADLDILENGVVSSPQAPPPYAVLPVVLPLRNPSLTSDSIIADVKRPL